MPRPTNPEIPEYLAPKSKERDTTYQKTKKQKTVEIESYNPLACHSGAPVIQNTKYASLFRRLGSPIQTNALRIQSNQLNLKQNQPSSVPPEFCPELRPPNPHRIRQESQSRRKVRQRNSSQDEKRAIRKKSPNPARPTEQLRVDPAGTILCWETRVNPLRMWAGNTRPQWPEDTKAHGS